jgi:CDK-activating kinase assembly factor MAT1
LDKPSLKLLVNVCGHHICDSCVDAVFTRPTAPCPECGVALRRSLYRAQQFEDPVVEREVDIRKKVLQDYNQLEGDFPSLRAYNDYLEEVETIVYNLCHGVDVEATREKMEHYRRENQALILRNREQQRRRERLAVQEVREEQQLQELRNRQALATAQGEAREKEKDMQSVIHELMVSERPAQEVVASHSAQLETAHTSIERDRSQPTFQGSMGTAVFDVVPASEEGERYCYQPPSQDLLGPGVPDVEELGGYGYLAHVREVEGPHVGSGYVAGYGCRRALQEAFSGLFCSHQQNTM